MCDECWYLKERVKELETMKGTVEQILAAQRDMILEAVMNHSSPEMGLLEKMGYERARMEIYRLVIGEKYEIKERK